ncbi:hypothetical protein D3C72_1371260 [compost metagenome]
MLLAGGVGRRRCVGKAGLFDAARKLRFQASQLRLIQLGVGRAGLEAVQRLLCTGLVRLVEAVRRQRVQGVAQAIGQQRHQPTLAQVPGGAGLGVAGLPVVVDHAGQHIDRLRPTLPRSCFQPGGDQMPRHAEMLALPAQVLTRGFVDVKPVQAGLLQATQLDHFVVDGLKGLVFFIEMAGRLARVQRRQQGLDVERGVVGHQ